MSYGDVTAFSQPTVMNSLPDGELKAIGEINLTSGPAHDVRVQITATLGTGTGDDTEHVLAAYFAESLDGTTYTDGMAVNTDDQASKLQFCPRLAVVDATDDGAVRKMVFSIGRAVGNTWKRGIVLVENASGAALAPSGHSANHMSSNF